MDSGLRVTLKVIEGEGRFDNGRLFANRGLIAASFRHLTHHYCEAFLKMNVNMNYILRRAIRIFRMGCTRKGSSSCDDDQDCRENPSAYSSNSPRFNYTTCQRCHRKRILKRSHPKRKRSKNQDTKINR